MVEDGVVVAVEEEVVLDVSLEFQITIMCQNHNPLKQIQLLKLKLTRFGLISFRMIKTAAFKLWISLLIKCLKKEELWKLVQALEE